MPVALLKELSNMVWPNSLMVPRYIWVKSAPKIAKMRGDFYGGVYDVCNFLGDIKHI